MTRDEWIRRYAKRMVEGGSWMTEEQAIASAECVADDSEAAGWLNPQEWENPEALADEHLSSE